MSVRLDIAWGDGTPPPVFAAALHPVDGALDDREAPLARARWCVATSGETPVARLAVYLRKDDAATDAVGMIGHYAAADSHSGLAVLDAALHELRGRGATRVLGPMNGSTWSRYRFALPPSHDQLPEEPPFPGEPVNPAVYPAHFIAAGFHPVAHYESRITAPFDADDPRVPAAAKAASQRGIDIAPLNIDAFEATLDELHALSVRTFAENVFYSPIDREMFTAMYRPMRNMLEPSLVLLAREATGQLIGYVFAYIDPLGMNRGRPYRVIVKTLAVDAPWRSAGLGALLVHRVHTVARQMGMSAVVHALMHEANNSVRISARMRVFRQYALYEHTGTAGGA